jgi:hypothetical protein
MPLSGAQPADSVPHVDPIGSASSLYWPVMDREGNRVSASERHQLRSRLHTRALLSQQKFATGKVFPGLR